MNDDSISVAEDLGIRNLQGAAAAGGHKANPTGISSNGKPLNRAVINDQRAAGK